MNFDWKQLLRGRQNKVFGLDVGSSTIKMVQLHKNGGGYIVTAAGIAQISDDADADRKEANIVMAIRVCMQSAGIEVPMAACGVCGPEVAVRHFKFPLLPAAEMEGAVLLEASQTCPFNIDDGVVDYQLIPDGQENITGVLVVATNRMVERKTRLAREAFLNAVLMDVDGLALLNCFGECEQSKTTGTMAILNIGSSFTNLVIMGSDALPFIRDIAYAGNDIIKQIAEENDISVSAVSRILAGHEESDKIQSELADSMKKASQKLITDVAETLRYYAAQRKAPFIEKIFVCGGFALVDGFVEMLNNQFPAEVKLWNPFDKMRCDANQACEKLLQKNGPAMAVAAGLAMRSI